MTSVNRVRTRIPDIIDSASVRLRSLLRTRSGTIFMFHAIGDVPVRLASGDLSPAHSLDTFANFLAWLSETSEVVDLPDLLAGRNSLERSRHVATITFDDGCRDNYERAFPLLLERGFPATFFVPLCMIDHESGLTRSMIREMGTAGMTFGSHGVSHVRFTDLSLQDLRRELQESREALQALTEQPCDGCAYPFGAFSQEVAHETRSAGYRFALGADEKLSPKDNYALPRSYVNEPSSKEEFLVRLYNARTWRRRLRKVIPGRVPEDV